MATLALAIIALACLPYALAALVAFWAIMGWLAYQTLATFGSLLSFRSALLIGLGILGTVLGTLH